MSTIYNKTDNYALLSDGIIKQSTAWKHLLFS